MGIYRILDQVLDTTGEPITITRKGKAIADYANSPSQLESYLSHTVLNQRGSRGSVSCGLVR
jgi:antitoxin (DNA-binding transcriptional repressor) of toxin-antitoxin stability system